MIRIMFGLYYWQIGVYYRFSLKSDLGRVHGWCCNYSISSTTKGITWDISFYHKNAICSCYVLCFPWNKRGKEIKPRNLFDLILTKMLTLPHFGNLYTQWSWHTIVMGLSFLIFLLATRHIVSILAIFLALNHFCFLDFTLIHWHCVHWIRAWRNQSSFGFQPQLH